MHSSHTNTKKLFLNKSFYFNANNLISFRGLPSNKAPAQIIQPGHKYINTWLTLSQSLKALAVKNPQLFTLLKVKIIFLSIVLRLGI